MVNILILLAVLLIPSIIAIIASLCFKVGNNIINKYTNQIRKESDN